MTAEGLGLSFVGIIGLLLNPSKHMKYEVKNVIVSECMN